MTRLLMLAVVFAGAVLVWAEEVRVYNVPVAVTECLGGDKSRSRYAISGHINPFYLRGDFNGDGRQDYAVLIREKTKQEHGIAICHAGTHDPILLGAGNPLTVPEATPWVDINLDAWKVYERKRVEQVCEEAGPPPRLVGEGIEVEKEEAWGGIIYWNGKGYAYYDFCG